MTNDEFIDLVMNCAWELSEEKYKAMEEATSPSIHDGHLSSWRGIHELKAKIVGRMLKEKNHD